ncbi:Trypsin [Actinokineospora alba]|uniref:Trypsin n=1 Tax=Actinokineospora alba TaxID=504798 RepID=A0A1H0TYZ7_9PSEU|nr:trypsin-like serine protease [Actinokineospora alba]TDP70802.1 trypsin [Actinokineospora alba]SDJ16878.1 Trypsin [Actinokineospora alba]SDP59144.1 Trypsin [Actinokineospora alba]
MKRFVIKAGLCVAAIVATLVPAAGSAGAVKGGEHTTHDQYPWTVVITRAGSAHPQKVSCGGALVRPNKVVTAAHCMDPQYGDIKDKTVIWGRTDLTTTAGTVAKITSYWKVPEYQWGSLAGDDVAVLTLDQNVGTPSSLLAIAGPGDTALNAVGTSTTLSTWGKSGAGTTSADYDPVMKKATLPIIDPDASGGCKNIGWTFTPEKQLCFGPVKNDTLGVCSGDSGSPLVASTPAGYRLVGLIESGDSNCAGPQVGAKITQYESRIREQLGDPTGDDFSLGVAPDTLSVQPGQSGTVKVATTVTGGAAQTVTLAASGLPAGVTAKFDPASVTAGASSALTLSAAASATPGSVKVTVTGTGTSATKSASIALTVAGGGGGGLTNGGFEAGDLTGWTSGGTGASSTVVNSGAHGGTHAVRLGATTATNGESTVRQTFTAAASGQLSFWYAQTCPDTVKYAWAKATLTDDTAGTMTTPLAKTCTDGQGWKQITAQLTAGHTYTLTLLNRDDNHPNDPVHTFYDDVTVASTAISASTTQRLDA